MSRVLLAEDDAQSLLLAKVRLEAAGFEVEAVQTGREALAAARARRPDVAALDLALSDMPAAELIAGLRAIPGPGKFPIIALTPLDAFELHRKSLSAEIAEFLPKTCGTQELLETVTALGGGGSKPQFGGNGPHSVQR